MNEPTPPAIVITGMHRSRTSLLALFLEAVGVSIGDALLPGDAGNPTGYGEDTEILEIQRRLVAEACAPHDAGGWPDWGWTPAERFAPPACTESELRAYAQRRRDRVGPHTAAWGWKEPRTTLLLEQWERILPDAGRVFVYRHPLGVQESMKRLGFAPEISARALDIWGFYNEAILRALTRHPERCVLVESSAVATAPDTLVRLVEEVIGADLPGDPVSASRSLVDPQRLAHPGENGSPAADAALPDRARRILGSLEARASWRP